MSDPKYPRGLRWAEDRRYGGGVNGFGIVASFAVGALVLVVLITGIAAFANEQGCAAKGDEYSIESDYRFWAGTCFAEVDGRTVNMDNVRENSRGQTIYFEGDLKEVLK